MAKIQKILSLYYNYKIEEMHYYYYPMVPYPIEGRPIVEEPTVKVEQQASLYQFPVIKQQIIDEQIIRVGQQTLQTTLNIILTRQDLEKVGYQVSKKVWSEQEDRLLIHFKEVKKLNWNQISRKLIDRNSKMCYSRYRRLKNSTKMLWRKKDDDKLLKLIDQLGQNWQEIIIHFKRRNIRQLKEHYNNYLRPGIIQRQWTIQDDIKLIVLLNKYGNNWKNIEENILQRSLNQIKNRYYGRIKKLNDLKLSDLKEKRN